MAAVLMTICSCCVEERFAASVTWAVKFDVPAVVGVPVITPPVDIVRPAGSDPAVMDQVYGAVPPEAPRVCWGYTVPAVPPGSAVVVMVGGAAAVPMTICSGCDAERFAESVTLAVKFDVPAVVGVPVIVPVLESVRPAGSDPALMDHVYGVVPPEAPRVCCGYTVPAVPPGSDVVVMVGGVGAGLITICSGCVLDKFAESVTLTVKLDVPAVVGVPVIVPVLDNVRPAGRDPALMVHVYGAVPPDTPRVCCGYAVPAVPPGSDVVVMVGGVAAALMTICSGCVAERFAASVTWAVKLDVPAVVGVPLIMPVLDNVRPAGSDPALIDQVYGAVPPDARRVCCGYGVATVPPGSEVVVMVGGAGAGLMTICSDWVSERFSASTTLTTNLNVPAVVGVPVMVPLLFSVNPAGNEPLLIDHVSGAVPPVAVTVCV